MAREPALSVRNLEALFRPASVAVIGASDRPGSIGALVMRNLLQGGFAGPVWPVNPRRETVAGLRAWTAVGQLPQAPDLAVICTPAPTVPGLVAELGRKGTRAAVVLTAGLKAGQQPGGPTLEQAMLDAARPHLLRILGPNCVGLLVPGAGLNASFAHLAARPGRLAFVSQSGALATAMLDWSDARGIGFSHFISLGDSADVDFGDVLDYLASDAGTRAILMYVESVKHARKFLSAARAAARNKPVLLVKAGRAPEGARAAASHTGALAGSDAVFDAAVRRAGMLRVLTLEDLFDAAETLARAHPLHGERLAIVTNGGGAGVLAADALAVAGGTLAPLEAATLARLDAALPATWSHGNPVDIIGDAPVARYTAALQAVLDAPETDAVLFMHAPTAVVPSAEIAAACLPLMRAATKPVLTCWLGGTAVAAARAACAEAGVPTYETPERAAQAYLHLVQHRCNQEALLQAPAARGDGAAPDAAHCSTPHWPKGAAS
jgi:acetyltransferase